jgi:hypothetical protein
MSTQITASAVIGGTDAIFGWGPAQLFRAALEEMAFYHQTNDDAARLAHAQAAQAYGFLAMGKADPDVQETGRPERVPPAPVVLPAGPAEVLNYLLAIRDSRSADEQDSIDEVLAILYEDPEAARS